MTHCPKVVSVFAKALKPVLSGTALGVILGSVVASMAAAQDLCRDDFVGCVAETGSPLECQSAYLACSDQGLITSSHAGVSTETSLQDGDNYSVALTTVTNNTADTIDIGNISINIICQDGSAEVAYFTFRPGLSSGGSLLSSPQRVCVGNAPARVVSNNPADNTSIHRSAMQFQCPSEPNTLISVSWLGGTAVKAVKNNTTHTFNVTQHTTETILAELCAKQEDAEPSVFLELKELLRDYIGENTGDPDRVGTIGVRG